MKLHSTLLAACASLALGATGCLVGEIDDPNAPIDTPPDTSGGTIDPSPENPPPAATQNPEELFTSQVAPALAATCGLAGCHAAGAQDPAFVAADPATSYTLIKNFKDQLFPGYSTVNSRLLENGEGGGHYGASFDTLQVQAIQNWLALEAAQPVDNTVSPLAEWSGCMDLAEFQAAGVADAWADKGTNQGNCDACHNLGADGFIASNVDVRVFDTITQDPGFMLSYFTIDETGTNVIVNTARFQKVGQRQAPHLAHPAFNVNGNAMDRLQNFYQQTLARKTAGTCLPPRFGAPTP